MADKLNMKFFLCAISFAFSGSALAFTDTVAGSPSLLSKSSSSSKKSNSVNSSYFLFMNSIVENGKCKKDSIDQLLKGFNVRGQGSFSSTGLNLLNNFIPSEVLPEFNFAMSSLNSTQTQGCVPLQTDKSLQAFVNDGLSIVWFQNISDEKAVLKQTFQIREGKVWRFVKFNDGSTMLQATSVHDSKKIFFEMHLDENNMPVSMMKSEDKNYVEIDFIKQTIHAKSNGYDVVVKSYRVDKAAAVTGAHDLDLVYECKTDPENNIVNFNLATQNKQTGLDITIRAPELFESKQPDK